MVERISAMDKAEPPSAPRTNSLFRIGKNRRGQWVVQNQTGLCGGLFVSRAEAVKFAMFENGNRPQAVIMVPGILELDMSGKPSEGTRSTADSHAPLSGSTRTSLPPLDRFAPCWRSAAFGSRQAPGMNKPAPSRRGATTRALSRRWREVRCSNSVCRSWLAN
jgi:hypothetical protein